MPQDITILRAFKDHNEGVNRVAMLPDGRRMVSCSNGRTLRLWDLRTGVVLKKMEGHYDKVIALAVSRDGRLIASGDESGEVIAWQGETGEPLTEAIKAHSYAIRSIDFSPDGAALATACSIYELKLWSTETWQIQGDPIRCSRIICCIRYSPSGEHLAVATGGNIEIYNSRTRDCVAKFKGHRGHNLSLAWISDGTRLLSGGSYHDPNIREWDTSSWQQVGDPWTAHSYLTDIKAIAIHPTNTLVATISGRNRIRLWQISDRKTIAVFVHCTPLRCVSFSFGGGYIFSCGGKEIVVWAVPFAKNTPDEQASKDTFLKDIPDNGVTQNASRRRILLQGACFGVLFMNSRARNACISGDLPTAEQSLTQEIDTNSKNYVSYANRSFVMARKLDWDQALHDATASVSIKPSLIGHTTKGLALCGKQQFWDAMKAFDLAFTFTDGDSNKAHFLFLIKSIALFNANNDEEGVLPVQELAIRPNPDPLACRVVEAYMRVQLGTIAVNGARHEEAANHFTAAVEAGAFFSTLDIHSKYEDFVVLFGWDLKSLWQIANQQRCHALLRTGRFGAALESYRHMMDMSDEPTKAIFLAWTSDLDEFE